MLGKKARTAGGGKCRSLKRGTGGHVPNDREELNGNEFPGLGVIRPNKIKRANLTVQGELGPASALDKQERPDDWDGIAKMGPESYVKSISY